MIVWTPTTLAARNRAPQNSLAEPIQGSSFDRQDANLGRRSSTFGDFLAPGSFARAWQAQSQ